eukprot:1968431-Rhodomonas_salina.1
MQKFFVFCTTLCIWLLYIQVSGQESCHGGDGLPCQPEEAFEDTASFIRVSLAGDYPVCDQLFVDPKPRGSGANHVVFKAFSSWNEAVALHVPFWNTLEAANGFHAILSSQADQSGPYSGGEEHILRVLGICIDTAGSNFWSAHSKYLHAGGSATVAVTEWLDPRRHGTWDEFMSSRGADLRAAGQDICLILSTLAGPAVSLARGMAYLSARGLLHGDLKQENVQVDFSNHRVVIGDINGVFRVEFDDHDISKPQATAVSCCERKTCQAMQRDQGHVGFHCPPECISCSPFLRHVEVWSL